jgi:CheY-like chemotaxis protein
MKLKVLLVEDNAMNAELARAILESAGHEVEDVGSGAALRAIIATGLVPDIVLMDIFLPDIDGVALLKELRAMPHLATVPIIATTANALAQDLARYVAAGFGGVLIKPIEVSTFATEVERLARGT